MGKTIRHNKHGKKYQERESAGFGYETNIKDSRGITIAKRSDKFMKFMVRESIVVGVILMNVMPKVIDVKVLNMYKENFFVEDFKEKLIK